MGEFFPKIIFFLSFHIKNREYLFLLPLPTINCIQNLLEYTIGYISILTIPTPLTFLPFNNDVLF